MALASLGLAPGGPTSPYGVRPPASFGAPGDAGVRPLPQHMRDDSQWVDMPALVQRSFPEVRPEQDMIYQWVDMPAVSRLPLQAAQTYMPPQPAPPYYSMEQYAHGLPADQFMPSALSGYHQQPQAAYQHRRDPYQYDDSRQKHRGGKPSGAVDRPRNGKAQSSLPVNGASGAAGRRVSESASELQNALEKLGREGLRNLLTKALESLYADQIKPMGNYVKGRLKEQECAESIVKSFVDLYSHHPDLFEVELGKQGEEPTLLFKSEKEPSWFKGWVDIDSAEDPYDEATWSAFGEYLTSDRSFPGGRYGMARELVQQKLDFLSRYSLGEVCHIVQLSIQHRKIIVYHRKVLKPIQAVIGGQLEENDKAVENADGCVEIKDMDELCLILFQILKQNPQGVLLCRMKHMIKREFQKTLSEMTFRCTKLIELFNQEPLSSSFMLNGDHNAKCLYVCRGDPEKFSDHVKALYLQAT